LIGGLAQAFSDEPLEVLSEPAREPGNCKPQGPGLGDEHGVHVDRDWPAAWMTAVFDTDAVASNSVPPKGYVPEPTD